MNTRIKNILFPYLAMAAMAGNNISHDPEYRIPNYKVNKTPTKKLYTFRVKGVDIKATSKKDAITKYKHLKK